MFFARVLLGKHESKSSDRSLLRPSEGFDSVHGNTKNCDVIIVYANKKAYPEFFITYTN